MTIPIGLKDHRWVYDGFGETDSFWSIEKIIPPFLKDSDEVWIEGVSTDIDCPFTEDYQSVSYQIFKEMKSQGLIISHLEAVGKGGNS